LHRGKLGAAPPKEKEKEEKNEAKQEPPANEKPAEKPAEKPVEKPAEKTSTIETRTVRGKVVDDATGEPVGRFVLQGGKFEPPDSEKVTWGYWQRSCSGGGLFDTTVRWPEGWTARVVADGYVPHPVLSSAPPEGKGDVEVTIRLKRGSKVRG